MLCTGFFLNDLFSETWLGDSQCPFVFVFIFLARLMYLKDILSLWFTGIRRGIGASFNERPRSPSRDENYILGERFLFLPLGGRRQCFASF